MIFYRYILKNIILGWANNTNETFKLPITN